MQEIVYLPVAVEQLNQLQLRFKNAMALLTNFDNVQRTALLSKIPAGSLRMLECSSLESEIARVIVMSYNDMKDTTKFRLQTSYFQHMETQLTTPEKLTTILTQYLNTIGVTTVDIQLLLESVAQGSSIILASEHELCENCPMDIYSIQLVIELFQNNRLT